MSPVPTLSTICFIFVSSLFGVLSIGCVMASTRMMNFKLKQRLSISRILKDKNFNLFQAKQKNMFVSGRLMI